MLTSNDVHEPTLLLTESFFVAIFSISLVLLVICQIYRYKFINIHLNNKKTLQCLSLVQNCVKKHLITFHKHVHEGSWECLDPRTKVRRIDEASCGSRRLEFWAISRTKKPLFVRRRVHTSFEISVRLDDVITSTNPRRTKVSTDRLCNFSNVL